MAPPAPFLVTPAPNQLQIALHMYRMCTDKILEAGVHCVRYFFKKFKFISQLKLISPLNFTDKVVPHTHNIRSLGVIRRGNFEMYWYGTPEVRSDSTGYLIN